MFLHQGIWLPDGEKHFPDWMTRNGEVVDGRGTYQIRKLREAMKHVKQFRVAVDVGAHVGLWSMQLMKLFKQIEAFEPVTPFRECFVANTAVRPFGSKAALCQVNLHALALGDSVGSVTMKVDPFDTGGTHVGAVGAGDAWMCRLDDFELDDVDFLKIDCEGYELEVLKGARDTISRCTPTVIVEQKPHKLLPNFGIKGAPAVDFLLERKYVVRREMGGDFILSV
jgi:FkbM family methyltransferase